MSSLLVRVAGDETRDGARLTRRFLVRSAVAFLVIGVLVHVLVGRQVEARYQGFAEFHAEFVAESLLKHELAENGVVEGAATDAELEQIHDFIDEYVMVGDVLRLKVWAPDGTIVLADDRSLVGQRSPEQALHLAEILENGVETELVEEPTEGDVGAIRHTIETYVPVWVAGDGAVVEIYQDLEPTIAAAHAFTRTLDLILIAGLGGLWLLLIPLMRRAARRLQRQNRALERLLAQEKDTVRRLEELNEMKDTFLSAVSHELRTPLTVLKTGTETLRTHGNVLSPELRDDLVERIGRNADRLESLLASLLDLDRLSRGTIDAHRQPVGLNELVATVLESLPPTRRVNWNVPDVRVQVDRPQVERVVENLIVNALRHTPDGVEVRVLADIRDETVELRVEDDGPGVPDHLKEELFEAFTQGEVLHPESPGTGVGLALVKRFTELNGGRAWIEDSPSGGASFRIELPRVRETDADHAGEDADRQDRPSTDNGVPTFTGAMEDEGALTGAP